MNPRNRESAIEIRSPMAIRHDPTTFVPNKTVQYQDNEPNLYFDEAYDHSLYVWKCVNTIANTVSGLPFRAGSDPGKPMKYQSPTYSRLAYFLSPPPGSPNPLWTPRALWRYITIHRVLLGKFALWKEYGPEGNLIALWPLMSQHIRPLLNTTRNGTSYFSGYEYGTRGSRGYKEFSAKEVLYYHNPSAKNFLEAESPLKAGAINVSVASLLEQYDYAFLRNNATPSTIITTEAFREDEQRRAFREQFLAAHGGAHNAGRTMFLEAEPDETAEGSLQSNVGAKVSVQRLGLTAEEAQHDQLREAYRDDICLLLGVPRSIIGDSSERTYANAAQENQNYWRHTMVPLLAELKDAVNIFLAPELDNGRYSGWFDLSSVKALKDTVFEGADLIKATELGILTPDETREQLGYEPLKGEIKPLSALTEQPDQDTALAGPARPRRPEGAPATNPVKTPAAPARRPVAPVVDRVPARRDDAVFAKIESAFATAIESVLIKQESSLSSGRRGEQARSNPSAVVLDFEHHEMKIREALVPLWLFAYATTPDLRLPELDFIAARIVADTQERLRTASTLDEAFADKSDRAVQVAHQILNPNEGFPADHLTFLLSAISEQRISADRAMEIVSGD